MATGAVTHAPKDVAGEMLADYVIAVALGLRVCYLEALDAALYIVTVFALRQRLHLEKGVPYLGSFLDWFLVKNATGTIMSDLHHRSEWQKSFILQRSLLQYRVAAEVLL